MIQSTVETAGEIRRILVVRPNHRLGNNVLLTPLLSELERRFPQATIDILTGGGASHNLYAEYRSLTAVHAFPAWSYIRPHVVARVIRGVRAQQYDLAIDSTTKSRSARFLLSLVRARRKIGYAWGVGWRDRILTDAVSVNGAPVHHGKIPVYLVRQVFGGDGAPWPTLDLRLNASERALGQRLVAEALGQTSGASAAASAATRVLRVGVYCTATGAKHYSDDWWGALVEALQRRVWPGRLELIEFLPHDGRSGLAGRLPTLLSVKLRELCGALSAVDVFVTGDCGVMHLASAAGTQVVGLFKVTDADRYGPYGHGSESLAARDDDVAAVARRVETLLRERFDASPPV